MPENRKPPAPTGNAVDDFLAMRNYRADRKLSALPGTRSREEVDAADGTRDVTSREVFDEDDFIEARNAQAAARPNPLATPKNP